MTKQRMAWLAITLLLVLWAVGACAEPSQSDVTVPLIGEDRDAAQVGAQEGVQDTGQDAAGIAVPQQIVVILMTPTPAGNTGTGSGGSSGDSSGPQSSASGEDGGQQMSEQQLAEQGSTLYSSNCATCHGPNGEGGASYPPLAGSAVLTAQDPADAIDIVLNGRGQMPGFSGQLTHEQVAAVLTHERTSWDNNASAVQISQVEQVASGGQQQPGQQQEAQPQSGQEQSSQEQNGQAQGDQQQASQQQPDQQQSGQESAGQQSAGQQNASGASASASEAASGAVSGAVSGEIVIQLQIMVVTPEASGGSSGSEPQPESTPTPTPAPTQDGTGSDGGTDSQSSQSGSSTDDQTQSGGNAGGQGRTVPIQIRVIVDTAGNVTLEPVDGAGSDNGGTP